MQTHTRHTGRSTNISKPIPPCITLLNIHCITRCCVESGQHTRSCWCLVLFVKQLHKVSGVMVIFHLVTQVQFPEAPRVCNLEQRQGQVPPLGSSPVQHRGGFVQQLRYLFAQYDTDSNKRVLSYDVVIKDGQDEDGTFPSYFLSWSRRRGKGGR